MSDTTTDTVSVTEAYERGRAHGYDAANFAEAYGSDETPSGEGFRRANDQYPYSVQEPERRAYEKGFAEGYQAYKEEVVDVD